MPLKHLLVILLVVVVWGVNFVFVRFILDECPPLLLCAMRFFLASIPFLFFIPRPKEDFAWVALYGLIMFGLQFALLFTGMSMGVSPGLSSILMQTQVFFSMFFAVFFLGESIRLPQIIGACISFIGIALIGAHVDASMSTVGFLFILGASVSWGIANNITKKISKVNRMSIIAWGSLVAALPMLLLSLAIEGMDQWHLTLQRLTPLGIGSFLYVVLVSTYVGYGLWNWLLGKYPISTIVPYSLLVPIVGVICSITVLGESFEWWKVLAGILVLSGLGIHLGGSRIQLKRAEAAAAATI